LVFIFNFRYSFISNETSDWGSFSDYLNPFVSLANLILIAFITYFVNKTNLLVEKPTIVFAWDNDNKKYRIKNIGKGAALNIVLKHKEKRDSEGWDSNVLCYSLGQNDEILIKWSKGEDEWIAYYDDIFDNHYFSNIRDDYVKIGKINNKEYKILKQEEKERIYNK